METPDSDSEPDVNQVLHDMAEAGGEIQQFIAHLTAPGVDINWRDESGRTTLGMAACKGRLPMVDVLLNRGAHVDLADDTGRTPLQHAAREGHLAVVGLLLDKGAQVDYKNCGTPLQLAAKQGHLAVVELLLSKGAQVNFADMQWGTPLQHAANQGHLAVVELLLSKGAQVNLADKTGRTPLQCAAEDGHLAVVGLLLDQGAQVDLADRVGRTPLQWAAENGHLAGVSLLLDKGAQMDLPDRDRQTPLQLAAKGGHLAVVGLLLDRGSQVDLADKDGQTPLHFAAKGGHPAVVGLLLDKGSQVDTADRNGQTALQRAAVKGHLAVVGLLLDKGAQVDLADEIGRTPLQWAGGKGHLAVVGMLLNKGAQVESADQDGHTPLMRAAFDGHLAVMELLLNKGAQANLANEDGQTPLQFAAKGGHLAVVGLLLDKGAQVDLADEDGQTPLQLAASDGHLAVVGLLLDKGAQVDLADKEGRTALHAAAMENKVDMIKCLLEHGAKSSVTDNAGDKPSDLVKSGQAADVLFAAALRTVKYRGQYEINTSQAPISGAFGLVVMAYDTAGGQNVAIKFSATASERDNTVRVLQLLNGAFVAPLASTSRDDCVFDDPDKYPLTPHAVVMVAGDQTLEEIMTEAVERGRRLPENYVRFLFECLMEAVSHMHERDIVHGDLKPKNCIKFFDGRLRLIDFDEAVFMSSKGDAELAGHITPEICPPELAKALTNGAKMPRAAKGTDVWSLGCILFQLMTGDKFFMALMDADSNNEEASHEEVLAALASLQSDQERVNRVLAAAFESMKDRAIGQQAISLLKRMLQVDPKKRITIEDVKLSPFAKGDLTKTLKDTMWGRLEQTQKEILDNQDEQMAILKEVATNVRDVKEYTVCLPDMAVEIRKGFLDVKHKLSSVTALMVAMAEQQCPTTFIIVPDETVQSQTVDWLKARITGKAPLGQDLAAVEAVSTEWLEQLTSVFSISDTVSRLVARYSKRKFWLKLLCDKCHEVCEPAYPIERASEALVALLPALQVSFKLLQVANVALNVARCFFPVVPVLPEGYKKHFNRLLDTVRDKSSAAQFECVQTALDDVGSSGAGSGDAPGGSKPNQVTVSAHKLKQFLKEHDKTNQWGGLTRVVLADEPAASSSTSSAAGGGSPGPVLWCCSRCLQEADETPVSSSTAAGGVDVQELQSLRDELQTAKKGAAEAASLRDQLQEAKQANARLLARSALEKANASHGEEVGCFGRRSGSPSSGSGSKVHPTS